MQSKVGVQGVEALGGHFVTLCQDTERDLTPNFPTFSNPILNLNFDINANPVSTYASNI